ncbi:hypothetical protein GCM10029976_093900 [Kribbella albertanoniae]
MSEAPLGVRGWAGYGARQPQATFASVTGRIIHLRAFHTVQYDVEHGSTRCAPLKVVEGVLKVSRPCDVDHGSTVPAGARRLVGA